MAIAKAPRLVDLVNPVAQRLLGSGVPLGPNALITVRGRRSGQPRTTPVAVVEREGGRWVIGTFGEVNWVRNRDAAGEATIKVHGRQVQVRARRLPEAEAAAFFRDVVRPYAQSLPIGRLLLRLLGARQMLEDPAGAAARRPVFELREA